MKSAKSAMTKKVKRLQSVLKEFKELDEIEIPGKSPQGLQEGRDKRSSHRFRVEKTLRVQRDIICRQNGGRTQADFERWRNSCSKVIK